MCVVYSSLIHFQFRTRFFISSQIKQIFSRLGNVTSAGKPACPASKQRWANAFSVLSINTRCGLGGGGSGEHLDPVQMISGNLAVVLHDAGVDSIPARPKRSPNVGPMLAQRRDAGPALNQHRVNVSRLMVWRVGCTRFGWHPSKHGTLSQCWLNVGPTVYDVGPTLNQHWLNISCLLGYYL